jgi:hypothetical protein
VAHATTRPWKRQQNARSNTSRFRNLGYECTKQRHVQQVVERTQQRFANEVCIILIGVCRNGRLGSVGIHREFIRLRPGRSWKRSSIGLVGAHGDAFELLQFAEEVLDEMPPFVHVLIDGERFCAARMLGDDDLGAARVEFGDDGVAVERLVGDQCVEGQSLNEQRYAHRLEALSRRKHEVHEIAERIGERQDFGGHAALRTADRLALSPRFAPCP